MREENKNENPFLDKEFDDFLNSMGEEKNKEPTFTVKGFGVDITRRADDGYAEDMNRIPCFIDPFHGIPLQLQIFIMSDGSLKFRAWEWKCKDPLYNNGYLHVNEDELTNYGHKEFHPTPAQKETVLGLLSRRITWEGLNLSPGATLQKAVGDLTAEDIAAEENKAGKRMVFA